jgi:DNA-directed RNA polymerase subunit RPC12/RpoP
MSYVMCRNCGYKIPLSDIYSRESPILICPNCGSRSFTLYVDPSDFHTVMYLLSLLLASYIAPLIYHSQEIKKLINEESKEASKHEG